VLQLKHIAPPRRCDLATAAGPACAARAVASVRAEYGAHVLPEGLLRRIASAGCWSDFGAKLPPETLAEGAAAAAMQQTLPAASAAAATATPQGHRRRKTLGASFWRSWSAATAPKARQLQPLASFAFIDAYAAAAGSDAAEEFRAWCSSFFLRVDALCLKRADGARPAPADAPQPVQPAGSGDSGPWQRLGAVKRRTTYWWGGKAKDKAKPLERRSTLHV
jgi:hypothetical protein